VGVYGAICVGCPRLKVGQVNLIVAVNKVPACENADNHVVQAPLRHCAIKHGDCKVGAEVAVTISESDVTSHGHVQTSEDGRHTSGSCLPVRHDVAL